jgi:hypothetical protein
VAERVVDRLEAIDVEEQHGQRRGDPVRAGQRELEAVGQQGAVGQAGQRVVQRLLHEQLLGLLALARVADRPRDDRAVGLGLDEVVLGALVHRAHREVVVLAAGEHDDGDLGRRHGELVDALEPDGVGQAEVEQHAVDARLAQPLARVRDARRALELEVLARLEHVLDERGIRRAVVDQQHS